MGWQSHITACVREPRSPSLRRVYRRNTKGLMFSNVRHRYRHRARSLNELLQNVIISTTSLHCLWPISFTPTCREPVVRDFFYLKWLILVQIQLYFSRNIKQFTARTTTVTSYVTYCWRLRGVRSNQSNPSLRAWLQFLFLMPHSVCNTGYVINRLCIHDV